MTRKRFEIIITSPAARVIGERLPESVAAAVIEFITVPLLENPRRVGKELSRELAGIYSARKGTYRVLYRVNDDKREVIVLRIEHRGDVYRRRYHH